MVINTNGCLGFLNHNDLGSFDTINKPLKSSDMRRNDIPNHGQQLTLSKLLGFEKACFVVGYEVIWLKTEESVSFTP